MHGNYIIKRTFLVFIHSARFLAALHSPLLYRFPFNSAGIHCFVVFHLSLLFDIILKNEFTKISSIFIHSINFLGLKEWIIFINIETYPHLFSNLPPPKSPPLLCRWWWRINWFLLRQLFNFFYKRTREEFSFLTPLKKQISVIYIFKFENTYQEYFVISFTIAPKILCNFSIDMLWV